MQQLHVFYGLIGFSLLLVSFFLFIIWSLRKMQQHKQEAFKQVSLLAEVTAQEKEKNRMTLNLHEDFGPLLSTVKMYISNFSLTDDDEIMQRDKAQQIIDTVITKIRGIALEYSPYSLQNRNLNNALKEYVNAVNERNNHLITLLIQDPIPLLSANKAIHIYRIVQEIIDNTLEHAQATELMISIRKEKNILSLVTQDNGVGFDYQKELEKEAGIGLNNIATRIQLLKGELNVHSIKNKGTMYAITIPV